MSAISGTSTSAFLSCTPIASTATATTTVFSTSYITELPAACPTGSWMATYTINEICTGNPWEWTKPAFPAGFVVSTVQCDVCSPNEVVITCPAIQPTPAGGVPTISIEGNGVTASITASPVGAAGMGMPTSGAAAAAAAAAAAGSSGGSAAAAAAAAAAAGGNSAAAAAGAAAAGGSSAAAAAGAAAGAATEGNSTTPAVVTAGAPSLKRSIAVLSGLFFVAAGPLLLL